MPPSHSRTRSRRASSRWGRVMSGNFQRASSRVGVAARRRPCGWRARCAPAGGRRWSARLAAVAARPRRTCGRSLASAKPGQRCASLPVRSCALVFGQVDQQQPSAGAQHAGGLGHDAGRGPRRGAAPSAAPRCRRRRPAAAADTCRPAARRNARSRGRTAARGPAPASPSTHRRPAPGGPAGRAVPARGRCRCRYPAAGRAGFAGTSASNASSTAWAGSSRARISSQSAPLWRKLSEATRARSASTRAAWRRSASRIGSSGGRRASRSRARAPSSPGGRANQTLAPSRTRSSRPQSHSSFRWRDRRGCDWPRISVNSMTQNAPRAASASRRRRVGSAAARRLARRCSMGGA